MPATQSPPPSSKLRSQLEQGWSFPDHAWDSSAPREEYARTLQSPLGESVTIYSRLALMLELKPEVFAAESEVKLVRYHSSRPGIAGTALRNFVAPNLGAIASMSGS